jgi:hypothetical protein
MALCCLPLGFFLNGCVTSPPSGQSEPDEFKITVGAPFAESKSLQWEQGALVLRTFPASDDPDGRKTEAVLVPGKDQWAKFWTDMDAQDLWRWEENYQRREGETHQTDAPVWFVTIRRGTQATQARGQEIFTDRKRLGESESYRSFCDSVANLVGTDFCFRY